MQAFTVLPFFWQTWWFRSLSMASILGAAAFVGRTLTRRRLRRQIEEVERRHAIERERSRIARDIHDDLGASLTRITLLSQSARSELQNPAQAATELDQIYHTAREVTRSMDEIVWAVNPKHDTLDSLSAYLGKFAQDYLRGAAVRCRLDIPMELPSWPLTSDVRHNVFLAFKEILHNIVKHSGAAEVQISLSVDGNARAFELVILDDGQGFRSACVDGEKNSAPDRIVSGQGLTNISSRLAEVGGRCEYSSQPGRGTSTKLQVTMRDSP